MYVRDCGSLITVDGLQSIVEVNGSLYITDNASLQDITAFADSADGAVLDAVGAELVIGSNDALPDLSGLENVTTVGSSLIVDSCTQLATVVHLGAVTYVGGYVQITSNASLTSLTNLVDIIPGSGLDSFSPSTFATNPVGAALYIPAGPTSSNPNLPQSQVDDLVLQITP